MNICCFGAWSERMFKGGPAQFYSAEYFSDYPPLYMYVLYWIGFLRSILQIDYLSAPHILLLKLPAIACDLATSYLIFRAATKHLKPVKALSLMSSYLFLPAIIFNSSVWAQVDASHTLCVVLLCLFLNDGKMSAAYLAFGIGVLLKPQTLIFAPILMLGIYEHVFLPKIEKKKFLYNLFSGLSVILGMLVVALPFGMDKVITQYVSTLGSYPYASVNAYNFWAMLGMNWLKQDTKFMFFSTKTWGLLVILAIVALVFVFARRLKNNPAKYFILSAFIVLTMFMFSVRMHERYLFPLFALLTFVLIYQPSKALWGLFAGFATLHFYNTAHVFYFYTPGSIAKDDPIVLLISAGSLLFYVLFMRYLIRLMNSKAELLNKPKPRLEMDKPRKISKLDLILILGITLLYSVFAIPNLGSHTSPTNGVQLATNEALHFTFSETEVPHRLTYFIAPQNKTSFAIEKRDSDQEEWVSAGELYLKNVFTWESHDLAEPAKQLRLKLLDKSVHVLEFVFQDANGGIVLPQNASQYAALFDEASNFPQSNAYLHSMYFDEIYHARTAYEYLHGLPTHEKTHPPFGKTLVSIGIALFGMNPFGWRITGVLFGIFMLPLIYLFGKRMTKNTAAAALVTFLFAFDFMHLTQTRLATIDVFLTFFVLLMYYFMYIYSTMSFNVQPLKKTLWPLLGSGLAMGFALATKWSAAYSAFGLALVFFYCIYSRYREYLYAKADPFGSSAGVEHSAIVSGFGAKLWKTLLACVVFFVVLPILIYVLSYLPFVGEHSSGLLSRTLENQAFMLNFHSSLTASHAYSSSWMQWPIMLKPIWYYAEVVSENLRIGITALGHPLIWWVGIPAFFSNVAMLRRRSDGQLPSLQEDATVPKREVSLEDRKIAVFLIIAYLSSYLPWVLVPRISFIYHYFPAVPFVVLMIVHSLMQWKKRVSRRKFVIGVSVYAVLVLLVFLLFYPVLVGLPVDVNFVEKYLRWLPNWFFVSN